MDDKALIQIATQFLQTSEGEKIIDSASIPQNAIKNPSTPELRSYIITGRVYNKSTGDTIQGANIQPIQAGGKNVKTDQNGIFSLSIKVPVYPPNDKILSRPSLIISFNNLTIKPIELLTQERQLKLDVGTVGLISIEEEAKQKIGELKNEVNNKINQASNLVLELPEKVIIAQRSLVTKQINKAQNTLFPILIEILLLFNVTQIQDLNNQSCPSKDNIRQIVDRRNRLTRQINQIFTTIITNTTLAVIYGRLSNVFQKVKFNISSITLPLGAPLGVGIPYNIVSKLQNLETLVEDLSDEFKGKRKQLIVSLVFLLAALILIILILQAIDKKTQECIEDDDLIFEEINQQLLELSQTQTLEGENIPSLNGFTFEVISTKSEVGSLTRRQAVAKNSDGVIILRGEPSFSAIDQILIDELKFYIQTNNLKAF